VVTPEVQYLFDEWNDMICFLLLTSFASAAGAGVQLVWRLQHSMTKPCELRWERQRTGTSTEATLTYNREVAMLSRRRSRLFKWAGERPVDCL
jgi:hypothetical protein